MNRYKKVINAHLFCYVNTKYKNKFLVIENIIVAEQLQHGVRSVGLEHRSELRSHNTVR